MNTATIDFDLRIQAYFDVDVSEDGDFSYYYDDGEEEQAQQGVNVKTQLIDVKTYRLKKKMGQNSLSAEVRLCMGEGVALGAPIVWTRRSRRLLALRPAPWPTELGHTLKCPPTRHILRDPQLSSST